MDRQGYGYILNVASSAGLIPAGPYMATYYATKAYVTSLTRAVAEEFKQKNSRVYIGCLCPGPVDTEFNDVANVKFALKGISPSYCANYAIDMMKKRRIVIVPTLKMNTRYIRSFTTMDTVLTETCSILRTHPLLTAIWIRSLDVHIPVIFSVTAMAMLSKVGLFLSSNKGGFIK